MGIENMMPKLLPCFAAWRIRTHKPACLITLVASLTAALSVDLAAQILGRDAVALPQSVDLRPEFESFDLNPRVQGDRGTCSVFVMAQAIEFAYAKRLGQAPERLSIEYLNWASNLVNGESADGDFFSDLWAGFASFGISTEAAMPYAATYDPAALPFRAPWPFASLLNCLSSSTRHAPLGFS